jgi:hypothetical protein
MENGLEGLAVGRISASSVLSLSHLSLYNRYANMILACSMLPRIDATCVTYHPSWLVQASRGTNPAHRRGSHMWFQVPTAMLCISERDAEGIVTRNDTTMMMCRF